MSSMATGNADGAAERLLARDMIDVHGADAAIVARHNARTAALAGQRPRATSWLRVLGIIQQCRTDEETGPASPGKSLSSPPMPSSIQG
jgi:hypothetical protein